MIDQLCDAIAHDRIVIESRLQRELISEKKLALRALKKRSLRLLKRYHQ